MKYIFIKIYLCLIRKLMIKKFKCINELRKNQLFQFSQFSKTKNKKLRKIKERNNVILI